MVVGEEKELEAAVEVLGSLRCIVLPNNCMCLFLNNCMCLFFGS